ncbi:MAG: site-specific integrase [Candidatus Eisenbacteria bacterium]
MSPEPPRTDLRIQLEQYLLHLSLERRLSRRTVDAYGSDLAHHLDMLEEWDIVSRDHVTPDILREYLARLHDLGGAAQSDAGPGLCAGSMRSCSTRSCFQQSGGRPGGPAGFLGSGPT